MSVFQNELDTTLLDYSQQLRLDIQAVMSSMMPKVVGLDMLLNGAFSYTWSQFIKEDCDLGLLVSRSAHSFLRLLQAPATLYSEVPTERFVLDSATFLTKRFQADIAVVITGIRRISREDSDMTAQVMLGYSFYGDMCFRQVECSGSFLRCLEQLSNAVFGYLKMLFMKFITKNKK